MARLTWQNVQNPSFAGVSNSYRTMSQLLSRATDSGSAMVDIFNKTNSDAADRAIQQRLLGVQDPSQLADPSAVIGADGKRASMAMLQNIDKHRDTLIDRGVTVDTHDQNKLDWDWSNTGRDQLVQNQPQINALMADAAAGKPGAAEALARMNLRPDLAMELMGKGSQAISSRLNQNTGRQNLSDTQWASKRERAQAAFDDTAAADKETLYQLGIGVDPANDEAIINRLDWSPERLLRARGGAPSGAAPGATGGSRATPLLSTAAAGVSAAGAAPPPVGRVGSFTYDAPQQAVAGVFRAAGVQPAALAGIMGNFEVEGGYGDGQGDAGSDSSRSDGGSASGIAQWRKERKDAFQARYGKLPHQATHEEQAQFAVWELTTPEGRKVAGISKENADRILNAETPEEAAELFDKYYERSNGKSRDKRIAAARDAFSVLNSGGQGTSPAQELMTAATPGNRSQPARQDGVPEFGVLRPQVPQTEAEQRQAAVQAGLQRVLEPDIISRENAQTRDRLSSSRINTIIPEYEAALADDMSAPAAADLLVGKFGGSRATMIRQIQRVQDEGAKVPGQKKRINEAEAAAIIEASIQSGTDDRWDFFGATDRLWGNSLGGGGLGANDFAIDQAKMKELVADVASNTTRAGIQINEEESRRQVQVNAADEQVAGLMQTLQQAEAAKSAGRRGMDPLIDRINRQLEAAAAKSTQAAQALAEYQKQNPPTIVENARRPGEPMVDQYPTTFGLRDWRDVSKSIVNR